MLRLCIAYEVVQSSLKAPSGVGRTGRVYPSRERRLPFAREAIVKIIALLLQISIFERATFNKDS